MEQRLYDAAAKLPATDAKLDTSQMTMKSRSTNSIRRVVLTLAACAAAICIVLFSALFLASEVREYKDAVAYFSMHNLSTDGLSRREIKDVYKDIITGSFTHPKTAGVLAGIRDTEPTSPTDPAKPTDPDPTDPRKPTNPTDPTDLPTPTDPTDYPFTTEPTGPTSPTVPTNPADPDSSEAELLAKYFDLEKTHRPTFDEVLAIQEGTPVSDVVALIGKPHGFAPGHNWPAFWWETVEGYTFIIDLAVTSGFLSAQNTVERYFKYCTVDWVIPLIELEVQGGDTSENYDEAGIFNATQKYFAQREAYLLGEVSTINNVNPGLITDEDAHKAAIAGAGIEWLRSDIVIHAITYSDSHAQAVVTETVTYRENGVEKTEAIIHRVQLGQVDDGRIFTVRDMYYEVITGFKSCSYLAPPYQTPQPTLTKPTDPTDPPEHIEDDLFPDRGIPLRSMWF